MNKDRCKVDSIYEDLGSNTDLKTGYNEDRRGLLSPSTEIGGGGLIVPNFRA